MGEGNRLTDAAFVTALRVGDLSRQGKPPEERETGVSGVCVRTALANTQRLLPSPG